MVLCEWMKIVLMFNVLVGNIFWDEAGKISPPSLVLVYYPLSNRDKFIPLMLELHRDLLMMFDVIGYRYLITSLSTVALSVVTI